MKKSLKAILNDGRVNKTELAVLAYPHLTRPSATAQLCKQLLSNKKLPKAVVTQARELGKWLSRPISTDAAVLLRATDARLIRRQIAYALSPDSTQRAAVGVLERRLKGIPLTMSESNALRAYFRQLGLALTRSSNVPDSGISLHMSAQELRDLRTQKGWTQAKLATEAGIDSQNVSDYESGRKGIGRATAKLFTILLKPDAKL